MSEHRHELLACLQGAHDPMQGSAIVAFALVVELILPDGTRGAAKVTSDSRGDPLPWYTTQGLGAVLAPDVPEFDADERV